MKRLIAIICLALGLNLAAQAQIQSYAWTGTLGKSTSIRLEFQRNSDNILSGQMTYYRKNGQVAKIPVKGYYYPSQDKNSPDMVTLSEYDKRKECGHIFLLLRGMTIQPDSKWHLNDKEMLLSATKPVEMKGGPFFVSAKGDEVTGEYGFTYDSGNSMMPEYGGYVSLQYEDGVVTYSMNQVTPNIAETEGAASLVGNAFTGQVSNFKFRCRVYKDFLYVKRTNPQDGMVDDFGAHASLEGIYLRH